MNLEAKMQMMFIEWLAAHMDEEIGLGDAYDAGFRAAAEILTRLREHA